MRKVLIEGMMPYRALNRLHREGIFIKKAKKCQKNQIICTVDAKDVEKIFAIYPNMCYNGGKYTPYTARLLPSRGLAKAWNSVKNRKGIALGVLLFLGLTTFSDGLVLRVELIGATEYTAQVTEILSAHGVEKYARYPTEQSDKITADVLRLEGVGFCSVKKVGSTLVVEVRHAPFVGEGDGRDETPQSATPQIRTDEG